MSPRVVPKYLRTYSLSLVHTLFLLDSNKAVRWPSKVLDLATSSEYDPWYPIAQEHPESSTPPSRVPHLKSFTPSPLLQFLYHQSLTPEPFFPNPSSRIRHLESIVGRMLLSGKY